jgi:hypothetical protein
MAGTVSSTLNASIATELRAGIRIGMCIILLEECGYARHIRSVRVEEEIRWSFSSFAAKRSICSWKALFISDSF